jgi:ligand-binding sensor domain-containing protein
LTEAGGLLIAEGDTWQHFTTANGLPSDTISSLVYDTTGNLWIVTDQPGGIGLFDGATFSTFPELAETLGTVLYGAPDGGLWLGTSYNGLWFFDGQTWNRYGEDEGLFSNHLTSIFLDDQGLFWLGTAEQGLFTYDGQSSTNWPIENEPPFNAAQQILELNDGQIGFVELYGGPDLALYNPNDDTWTTLPTPGHTQAVAIDPDGSVWFGTNDGLWHVTAEGGQQRFSTADGLPGDNITSLAFGGDGGLWIGAQTGLAYHHPGDAEVPWRNFTDYIPSPYVTLLYTDPNGQVWIGLAAAEGRPAGLAQAIDGAITGIWLAGADLPEALQPIQETISGQPFPAELESITALSLDAAGHLWVGTWNAGLWRLTLDSGDWAMLGQADGAPASSVLTITAAPDGTIWFGTWYDGLWGFNEADGWWQDTTLDGLPGQAIFATYSATDGSLWLATEGGLARQ